MKPEAAMKQWRADLTAQLQAALESAPDAPHAVRDRFGYVTPPQGAQRSTIRVYVDAERKHKHKRRNAWEWEQGIDFRLDLFNFKPANPSRARRGAPDSWRLTDPMPARADA